jgi:hypothetical protein
MWTLEQIKDRIDELKKDERLYRKAATIFINAPLALTQMGLEIELNTLEKVAGLKLSKFPLVKKTK